MSLKTAIEGKQNPGPSKRQKLVNDIEHIIDFIKYEAKPNDAWADAQDKARDLIDVCYDLDLDTDWVIEGHRAKEMETEFLRDREGK